jgi:hypothetical protein
MIVRYLMYVVHVELCHVAGSLGFFHQKDGKLRIPFKVVGVMDCLPCCLTMSVELMLLSCGLGPHSQ